MTVAELRHMCVDRFAVSTTRATIMDSLQTVIDRLVSVAIVGIGGTDANADHHNGGTKHGLHGHCPPGAS